MEGKCILFKELGEVNAVPIVLDTQDTDALVNIVTNLAPSFGGINLEDISAPRCFEVEDRLQDIGIPVFHDDQHGTAIVVLAGLMNALKVVNKPLTGVRIVVSGAGASAIACAKMLALAGATNTVLVDRQGAIHLERSDLTAPKQEIARLMNPGGLTGDVHQVLEGADVFLGLSGPGLLNADDIRRMAPDPVVFAMANPVPEIMPDEAFAGGAAVVATGRSDFPNQVNNVLAFPGIFRGALSVRAPRITPEMRMAAAVALAEMVEEPHAKEILPSALDRSVAVRIGEAAAAVYR
ncbi:MAG: malic enzyme-like NAD(P)-binding protein, partial [Dehalococcoidia bacterium]